jgi:hypothetical protein
MEFYKTRQHFEVQKGFLSLKDRTLMIKENPIGEKIFSYNSKFFYISF